eukprot:gene6543-6769_t
MEPDDAQEETADNVKQVTVTAAAGIDSLTTIETASTQSPAAGSAETQPGLPLDTVAADNDPGLTSANQAAQDLQDGSASASAPVAAVFQAADISAEVLIQPATVESPAVALSTDSNSTEGANDQSDDAITDTAGHNDSKHVFTKEADQSPAEAAEIAASVVALEHSVVSENGAGISSSVQPPDDMPHHQDFEALQALDSAASTAADMAAAQPATTQSSASSGYMADILHAQTADEANSGAANAPVAALLPAPAAATTNTSKALLDAEGSSLSALSAEGSEMPGSRPPAQLHAGLDGHSRVLAADGQELDEEEQQEIHKIFSDIHGSGSEDDGEHMGHMGSSSGSPQPGVVQRGSGGALLAGAGSNSGNSNPLAAQGSAAGPANLAMPAATVQDNISSAGAAAATVLADSCLGMRNDGGSKGDAYSSDSAAAFDEVHRASPWPGVDQLQRELMAQTSSSFGGPHAAAALAAALAAAANAADAAAAGAAQLGSLVGQHDVVGAVDDDGQVVATGAEGVAGGSEAADDRSRAIAEQLAQLHEESRRLQMQSHVLQQRAMEMSLQMAVTGHTSGTPNSSSGAGGGSDGLYPDDLADSDNSSGVVVPLSQVHDLQAVMAGGPLNPHRSGLQQGLVAGDQDPQLVGMVRQGFAEDSLLGDINPAHLPRHPPGDSTPSSVTSSGRVGLNWNIPSRGSIPSPSKVDSFCSSAGPASPYLDSAGRQPREGGGNPFAQAGFLPFGAPPAASGVSAAVAAANISSSNRRAGGQWAGPASQPYTGRSNMQSYSGAAGALPLNPMGMPLLPGMIPFMGAVNVDGAMAYPGMMMGAGLKGKDKEHAQHSAFKQPAAGKVASMPPMPAANAPWGLPVPQQFGMMPLPGLPPGVMLLAPQLPGSQEQQQAGGIRGSKGQAGVGAEGGSRRPGWQK